MHQALRQRTEEESRILGDALSILETGGTAGENGHKAIEDLKQLRRRKDESLAATS